MQLSNKLVLGLTILSLIESLEEFASHVTKEQCKHLDKVIDELEGNLISTGWTNTEKTPEQYIETIIKCIPVVKEWAEEYEALERGE